MLAFLLTKFIIFLTWHKKDHDHQNVAVYQVDHLFQQQLADVWIKQVSN